LNDDSVETLRDLQKAVNDYVEETYDEASDFLNDVTLYVDQDDYVVGSEGQSVTYYVTKEAIEIVSVKISKY
jgi:hypothetical protein